MAAKPPDAFLSYTRFDDQNDGGAISEFRRRLANAVRAVTGETFEIFQDVDGIGLGEHWPGKLDEMLEETRFFIPILTPSFFRSQACRGELEKFLQAEKDKGRNDLVLPIYYIRCRLLEDPSLRERDPLASAIHERQHEDWRERRFKPFEDPEVRRSLEALAYKIDDARRRAWEEERERAEAERRAREEEARRQAEEQARTRSAAEQHRQAAGAEAKRRAEQDKRRRAEQEATRRDAAERERIQAEEAESKRQAEREARERAAQVEHRKADGEAHRRRAAERVSGASCEPDVFLGYAREDLTRARELATALEERGLSVFWDPKIPPGRDWANYIGEALSNSRCVVVAWSKHSVESDWGDRGSRSGLAPKDARPSPV